MKSATFASDEVLHKFKATKCEVTKDSTFLEIHGWKFHSSHDKICNSKDLLSLARNIESILNRNVSTPSTSDSLENSTGHEHHDNTSDHIHINGYSLHSPPMLFLNDCISIQHVFSKISITHRAGDALVAWAAQHSAKVMSQHPLEIFQVPYANTWTKRSLPQIDNNNSSNNNNNSSSLSTDVTDKIKSIAVAVAVDNNNKSKWDWTFTSDYCCTIDSVDNNNDDVELVSSHQVEKNSSSTIVTAIVLADCVDNNNTSSASSSQQQDQHLHQHQHFPFKYHSTATMTATADEGIQHSNPYATTSSSIDNNDHDRNNSSNCNPSSSSSTSSSHWQWRFEPAPHSGLDMALLRRGSENPIEAPILFYDEFTLYQDDLEDCGEVTFDVKVRVMPLCWFTLVRCFVRVDDGIVRMKETRLFHVFNTDDNNNASDNTAAVKIHVVVTWKELDLSSSTNSNTNSSSTSSSSPSVVVSQSLSKSILRNANELSEGMLVVNQKYNIPQFYTLHFIPPPSS